MKGYLGWFCAVCLFGGVVGVVGSIVASGCTYESRCECPPPCDGGVDNDGGGDGGGDGGDWQWTGWETDTAPNAAITGYYPGINYVTLDRGEPLTLTADECELPEGLEGSIPNVSFLPCTYAWDFGDGRTADGREPGAISFSDAGYYVVSLTASNGQGAPDQSPAELYVAVWDGEFSDDFNRADLAHHEHGWGQTFSDQLALGFTNPWQIEDNRLNVVMNDCLPAQTALLAWPEAQDTHIELFQERNPVEEHWTDIIVRLNFHGYGADAPELSFYRIRIWEDSPDGLDYHEGELNCIQIDIFRITREEGEFGTNIRGGDGLTIFTDQPFLCNWPREVGNDLQIEVDVVGNHFDVIVTNTANPAMVLEEHVDDTDPSAIVEPGRFGLGHCVGESFFDDYVVESLD